MDGCILTLPAPEWSGDVRSPEVREWREARWAAMKLGSTPVT